MQHKEEAKTNTGVSHPITSLSSFTNHKAYYTQNKSKWIIDTGAIDHMCMQHITLIDN